MHLRQNECPQGYDSGSSGSILVASVHASRLTSWQMEHTSVSSSSSVAPALNHSNGYPSAESAAAVADMVHGYYDSIGTMSDRSGKY